MALYVERVLHGSNYPPFLHLMQGPLILVGEADLIKVGIAVRRADRTASSRCPERHESHTCWQPTSALSRWLPDGGPAALGQDAPRTDIRMLPRSGRSGLCPSTRLRGSRPDPESGRPEGMAPATAVPALHHLARCQERVTQLREGGKPHRESSGRRYRFSPPSAGVSEGRRG